jgi:mRNA-degrading endonuclease RelE of RelBE toxin-antitoxin system
MSEKRWGVELSRSSLKALENYGAETTLRILDRLEGAENPLRHKDVRKLEGKLGGFYRFRVGDYRIIFELDPDAKRIGVLAIVPRGKGYRFSG